MVIFLLLIALFASFRIPFYIYLWSGRLHFVKKVKIVKPLRAHWVCANIAHVHTMCAQNKFFVHNECSQKNVFILIVSLKFFAFCIKISKPHDRVSDVQILIPCYFLLASKLPGYVIRIPPFLYAGI